MFLTAFNVLQKYGNQVFHPRISLGENKINIVNGPKSNVSYDDDDYNVGNMVENKQLRG